MSSIEPESSKQESLVSVSRMQSDQDDWSCDLRSPGRDGREIPPELVEAAEGILDAIRRRFEQEHAQRSLMELEHTVEALKRLPAGNPIVDELKRFAERVPEIAELVESERGMQYEQVERLLETLDPAVVDSGFRRLVSRLRTETDYFGELEDVGIAQALENGSLKGDYGARVKFIDPDSRKGRSMQKRGLKGYYRPHLDSISVLGNMPEAAEMWKTLATEGVLPEIVSVLDHELTHDAQFSKGQRVQMLSAPIIRFGSWLVVINQTNSLTGLAYLIGTYPIERKIVNDARNDKILGEVHAYSAAGSSPSNSDSRMDDAHEIIPHVAFGYGENFSDMGKATRAFKLLRALRGFGLDDREIGKLVCREKFDKKSRTFPGLEKRVDELREEFDLMDDQEFEIVFRAMGQKQLFDLAEQRALARRIASQELARLAALE